MNLTRAPLGIPLDSVKPDHALAPVTSVFRSTIGAAAQTSSVAADPSILAYRRVVETGRGGTARDLFPSGVPGDLPAEGQPLT
jgi:hypothetical protein